MLWQSDVCKLNTSPARWGIGGMDKVSRQMGFPCPVLSCVAQELCQASAAFFFFFSVKTALVSYLAIVRVEMLSHKGTKGKGVGWSQKFWLRDQAGAHLFDSTLQLFETMWSSNTMVKISAAVGQALLNKARANWARHFGKLCKMSKKKQTFAAVLVI